MSDNGALNMPLNQNNVKNEGYSGSIAARPNNSHPSFEDSSMSPSASLHSSTLQMHDADGQLLRNDNNDAASTYYISTSEHCIISPS